MAEAFLMDYWYVAEYPENIGRTLTRRILLNRPLVLYRQENGKPVALDDACPHRRLPLSAGRLNDDIVQCRYHGVEFGPTGACVKIPGQSGIPPESYGVRSYPLVERYGYVWIWLGDPERADESLLPDYDRLDDQDWSQTRGYFTLECNYLLTIDNLMDLSHVAYVHDTTSGNPSVVEEATIKVEQVGNRVFLKRTAFNVNPPSTFAKFGGYSGNIDLWIVSEFNPPSYIIGRYGSAPAGQGIPDGIDGTGIFLPGHWGFQVFHGITPETDKTTHHLRYVIAPLTENLHPEDFAVEMDKIIREDVAIYAIQQRALDVDPDRPTAWEIKTRAPIEADGGLFRARAVIKKLSQPAISNLKVQFGPPC